VPDDEGVEHVSTTKSTYGVTGMTCGHCVGAVADEIAALPGVRTVAVDLVAGGRSAVHVTSDAPLAEGDVRAAVDEAGYELASAGLQRDERTHR
jgi:copper chaperone